MNEAMPSGLKVFQPKMFLDNRGYFMETWNEKTWRDFGVEAKFVQDNQSLSEAGVIRGLHYQLEPYGQAKLVRVVTGSAVDFVLDIRPTSVTYGKMYYVHLSSKTNNQFFIPRGFAHGFYALEDNTTFCYKCDGYYSKELERGINILDPSLDVINSLNQFVASLGIKTEIREDQLNFSEKDKGHPNLAEADPWIPYIS